MPPYTEPPHPPRSMIPTVPLAKTSSKRDMGRERLLLEPEGGGLPSRSGERERVGEKGEEKRAKRRVRVRGEKERVLVGCVRLYIGRPELILCPPNEGTLSSESHSGLTSTMATQSTHINTHSHRRYAVCM